MIRRLALALILAPVVALCALPARAAFETRASAAWIFDMTTDTVLLSKDAEVPLPPASMSKLMTLNMLFESLRDGRVTLDTRFGVSSRATAMGGSSMYLKVTDRPTVQELIQGIIVQSGNDACVVVAEGLAGSEDAFARMMNTRAKDLGMNASTFVNSSGWPAPNHRMSMQDLGILSARIIDEFPEYYGYFSQKLFEYDGRVPANHNNRNPLLTLGIGADGLKTGHTSEAGYGLVGSATQGTRRIVFVITGLQSDTARAEEAERIVNWAFRQFVQKTVVTKGQEITRADVWLGLDDKIGLVAAKDIDVLIPALQQEKLTGNAIYTGPFEAPIVAGQRLGELVIALDGLPDARVDLLADRNVGVSGFLPRLKLAAQRLFSDFMSEAAELR
ncbi:D-alanyl-D-alanine carboxypeptidase family protein [Oceaniovalibus sp. ACAM 378]|jgi:D-alanyl-D-alanine carboxypeptidase (penicillin-binding protein 5/6)|uniref:D-alanyl-D-alanine carboxypeptidase family protein n=1 Tax=Oceaniovalibus sp. ACAM 378 TaxID=2599923 RepID=UPI0011D4BAA9|nr:D-alanyl-D-alanine carboxypeptidase family protein [Oceaniovalibus sp. ACAM 378]TYB89283.1 D-alanyl-D-alanine carboxypeptidase [Oceaniovalibus sp. ACAM 378]